MSTVLVIGSEGQVGSAFTGRLRSSGYKVIPWDIALEYRNDLTVEANNEGLTEAINQSDFVFNLACNVGGARYLTKEQGKLEYLSSNVKMLENFAAAYEESTCPPFVFASSQMSNMNHSQYGVIKRLGEFYTQALDGMSIKFWNVFGYETVPEKYHAISDFIATAMKGENIKLRSAGDEKRQFIHTDDCSSALLAVMQNYDDIKPFLNGDALDITNGEWVTIRTVAEYIADFFDVKVEFSADWLEDTQQMICNEPMTRMLLNKYWKPELTLWGGIKIVIGDML